MEKARHMIVIRITIVVIMEMIFELVTMSLNMSFNQLEGKIPITGFFKNLSQDFLRGNNELFSTDKDIAGRLGLSQCKAKKIYNHILLKVTYSIWRHFVNHCDQLLCMDIDFPKKRVKR
ncbi:hypothetical protein ACFE04_011587 [Oxalis oulophora]